jgi:predicted dehydrogenase
MNRRNFLKLSAAAGAGYWLTASAVSATRAGDQPNEKLHFAGIGVGGKGSSDIDHCAELGQVVAICDIDENTLNAKFNQKGLGRNRKDDTEQHYVKSKKYADYRKMFDEMAKQIDAVTVSTPDHTHAPASLMAMKLGKHVYCQKPMTHDVWEARQMRLVAKDKGVCTQLGNQGTAENGLRRAVELVRAGVLGKVTEVHVWTNRPIWAQAPDYKSRPTGKYDIPKHVHWDLFLGTAPERPYVSTYPDGPSKGKSVYHPFAWRGWWDFGTGALGDMACHTANMAFMALQLGSPKTASAEAGDVNPETCPSYAHVVLEFPARGELAPVTWNWYEGKKNGKKMLPPQELLAKVLRKDEKLADSGSILVGDNGILFSPNDYGAQFRLVGDGLEAAAKKVSDSLPRNGKGDSGQKREWVQAIRENKPEIALANFDYSGPLTETVLLGNVAIRTGKKLEFDGEKCEVTNCAEAGQYIKRHYRSGWEV